jgi:hypothetical protein
LQAQADRAADVPLEPMAAIVSTTDLADTILELVLLVIMCPPFPDSVWLSSFDARIRHNTELKKNMAISPTNPTEPIAVSPRSLNLQTH